MKDKVRSGAGRVRKAGKKAAEKTSSVAGKAASDTKQKVSDSAPVVARVAQDGSRIAVDKSVEAARLVRSSSKRVSNATASIAGALMETSQGVLASHLAQDLNGVLQKMVEGSSTIYDKAMDARYVTEHIGGGNHRLFDGGHTIGGAWNAVTDASQDDGIVQEAWGYLQGLLRDGTTAKGLPFANWDKATYDQVSGWLDSTFHIPKDWFYDLNSYDAAELLASSIGVVALALNWNRADTEQFSRMVGSMGLSAVITANPWLLIVSVVALAKAFHKAYQTGDYAELVDGQFRGAMGTGATLAAISLVAAAGGPVGVPLLAGLATGILVNKATNSVSVTQIGRVMARQASAAAAELKANLSSGEPERTESAPVTVLQDGHGRA